MLLDVRYMGWPAWKDRLRRTLACVNSLYEPTGLSWDLSDIDPWSPGADRHNLHALLDRIVQQPNDEGVTLGIPCGRSGRSTPTRAARSA
jgi:hypothetical protein